MKTKFEYKIFNFFKNYFYDTLIVIENLQIKYSMSYSTVVH